MRYLLCGLLALPIGLTGQTTGTCANPFESPVSPGQEIAMNLRSGDVTVVGADAAVLRIACNGGDATKIGFAAGHLTTRGGPDNNARFRIEVPRRANLRIRLTAGNLSVSGITGDKDIELNAGNLRIEAGDAAQWRHVDTSLWAGNIVATAFGFEQNGLFRGFKKDNPGGRYRLHAALLAGNLTLTR